MYIIYNNFSRRFTIKFPSKLASFLFVLFLLWQGAYSQLLYPEYKDKTGEYLPPYSPSNSIISKDVEKWISEQIANKDGNKKAIRMKTDLLGRAKSSKDGIGDGKVFVVEDKQKRLVVVSDMHIRENKIGTESGRYEYDAKTQKQDYFLNDKKISEKEYLEYLDESLETFKKQKRGKRDLPIPGVIGDADDRTWVALMTAEEILELVKRYKELSIHDYAEPKPLASQASILSYLRLYNYAFLNGYVGNGVGVYVTECTCAILSGITNSSKYTVGNSCGSSMIPEYNAHHTMVANIVQMASPSAHVFGFNIDRSGRAVINPSNPFSYSPPLEIGSHSYYINNSSFYNDYDRDMDNYIYENRVINFSSAGNDKNINVTSPGKAINVITVGAINPVTNRYADYYTNGMHWWSSSWKNPILIDRDNNSAQRMGSDKPEIATYTDIEFPNNSVYQTYYSYPYNNGNGFNGTSAASPLAAGFTATFLSQHPFFKRQPALMKAVLLTGETISIPNASSWDTDNGTNDYIGYNAPVVARGITDYSGIFCGWRSRWWRGNSSDHFNSNREIRFTEDNIQANKRYRIAIAYLVSGTYMYDHGKLPQDIDLYVYQNNQTIAVSQSGRNPFEVVDFTTTSSAPLTIRIYRPSNSGNDSLFLGYHIRENF